MSTHVSLDILARVHVASPCPVKWGEMRPVGEGDRVRHCDQCHLNVHNFSAMTRAEVESRLLNKQGRLCGRFYRRADGTMLTKDCPAGLAAVRARMARAASRIAAALAFLVSGSVLLAGRGREPLRDMEPFASLVRWLNPQGVVNPPVQMQVLQGDVCVMPPRAAQSPQTPGY
jgi:hypothetical protein